MKEVVFAGFGGQGILLGGKVLAQIAIEEGKEVTWMPTYGPSMRGGSANCIVKFGDDLIYNPDAEASDILIGMNEPGMKKCLPFVVPGGYVLINSNSTTLTRGSRDDVNYVCIPCVDVAVKAGSSRAANFVMLGAAAKLGKLFDFEVGVNVLKNYFGEKTKPQILAANIAAFEAGYNMFN